MEVFSFDAPLKSFLIFCFLILFFLGMYYFRGKINDCGGKKIPGFTVFF